MTKDEKPDAWMPLYPADWDAGTMHLTCEEDGAYGRLVRNYWRNGPPRDDDATLARIVRVDTKVWRRLRPVLAAFFTITEGVWRHKRVDHELVRWTEKRARAIERARKGGEAKAASSRKKSASSTQQAVLNGCTSASSREVEPIDGSTLSERDASASPPDGSGGARAGCPAELREAIVAKHGEAYAKTWLDRARWQDVPVRALVCRLGITAKQLQRDCRRELADAGVVVLTEEQARAA